jgi:hypothetical protein
LRRQRAPLPPDDPGRRRGGRRRRRDPLGPGTFAGGVTIDRSVKLFGAGPDVTIIRGGGPVITVGEFDAASEPTVTIRNVTITGGVTHSSAHCGPICGANYVQATALGGGIEVPPAAGSTTGATVAIIHSVVAGNRAEPLTTVPSVRAVCPGGPCPFATGGGGGIDNWGAMTLVDTVVRDNEIGGPVAAGGLGGGILGEGGTLTLRHSRVTGNRVIAAPPNGRQVDGGGIFAQAGTLTLDGATVADNLVELSTNFPAEVEIYAQSAGIDAGGATTTIRRTTIAGNTVTATNSVGDAVAFTGGLSANGPLSVRDSLLSGNHVAPRTATVAGNALADSGALTIGDAATATLRRTRLSGNDVTALAHGGTASATAGAIGTGTTQLTALSNSLVAANTLRAISAEGPAIVQGGGIFNLALLALQHTAVRSNRATAAGAGGTADGGGIWNSEFPDSPEPGRLTLTASAITDNRLAASPGILPRGGGVFATGPVTLVRSVIAHNSPDQCYGC